jgi:hypothetical protein
MPGFNMDDYVPVNERIEAFYKKHPDGSLQSEIVEHTETRVTVKAYAYRDRDDARPGTGLSSETIPGSTSFTKGSEVENAETSAWGRAIAALGFEVKRGIASREEMRRQQPERSERASSVRREGSKPATTSAPAPRNKGEALGFLAEVMREHNLTFATVDAIAKRQGIERGSATVEEIVDLIAAIESPGQPDESAHSSQAPAPATTPPVESSESTTATVATEDVNPSPGPSSAPSAPTLEDILEVTGGELVDVVPSELQERIDKARAKGKVVA